MVFHIAVCSPDGGLRAAVQRGCIGYFARRADGCIVEQLPSVEALLQRDAAGARYEQTLIELEPCPTPAGLAGAGALRRRGRRGALAFLAHSPAHAYTAYRLEAMQYLLLPLQEQELYRLLDRAVEPEYGPTLAVSTAGGLRLLPYGEIEYLECTHHVVHFHLSSGEDVASLSLRVPFSEVARPLLEDGRFLQPHRSYVVNLARVERVCADEMQMRTGARVPLPRGRAAEVRSAVTAWARCPGRSQKG